MDEAGARLEISNKIVGLTLMRNVRNDMCLQAEGTIYSTFFKKTE